MRAEDLTVDLHQHGQNFSGLLYKSTEEAAFIHQGLAQFHQGEIRIEVQFVHLAKTVFAQSDYFGMFVQLC